MKAMIISVGGTAEPIVRSIIEHQPEFICFLVSQQSMDLIGDIKARAKTNGCRFEDCKVVCDDKDDLVHCYTKALECAGRIGSRHVPSDEVVVDYTGGTKTMTAAIALATVRQGYQFSYVGGEERTKNGLGTVVSGTEVIKRGVSPWQIFAVEEKQRISLLASTFQYEAAVSIISQTIPTLGAADQQIWKAVLGILEGYLAWDNFDHRKALKTLSTGVKQLELCLKFHTDAAISDYYEKVSCNCSTLVEINDRTNYFKNIHPIMVQDIVSNAARRASQNKYDDAVARLYRALEMVGQIAFLEKTECSTSAAHPSVIPDSLREEYLRKYRSQDGDENLKIPLHATFRALRELNHPVGEKFFTHESEMNKILSARNNSILAHGIQPISRDTFEKFVEIIRGLFLDGPLIDFPELHWS